MPKVPCEGQGLVIVFCGGLMPFLLKLLKMIGYAQLLVSD